eukprot:4433743-Pleurochrysis_carterae.AAC.2
MSSHISAFRKEAVIECSRAGDGTTSVECKPDARLRQTNSSQSQHCKKNKDFITTSEIELPGIRRRPATLISAIVTKPASSF